METINSQRAILIVTILSSFSFPFMSSSVIVALPSIGQEFAMGPTLLGWISTSFLLAVAPLMIPFGRLSDIYGRKNIFVAGLLILFADSLLIALARSGEMIIACRVLQGISSAMLNATVFPIMVAAVPLSQRGYVLGLATAAVYFGLSAGPFLGGIITHYLGWRFIFWLNVPLSLALLMITCVTVENDQRNVRGEKFDSVGAFLLASGLLAVMYGFSSLPSPTGALLIGVGICDIIGFVFFEMKTSQPIVDINLFRHNAVFAFSNLAALINYAATFAVTFLLSFYLQNIKALTPQFAGLILVTQPIVQAVFSPMIGRLSDRMEPRLLASSGMGLTLLGLIMLVFLNGQSALYYILICLVVLGCGFALFSSPNTNAVMSSVDRQVYGVANATLSTMRQMGMTFSMGIVMMCISLFLGKAEIVPANQGQFLDGMRIAFVIFALMCCGGIFASLARGNMKRAEDKTARQG
jgi:EmrB/QacA subfamily drug resistance transporter